MKVTVQGPNLSASAQRKGQLHVHTAECGDNKQYGPFKPQGGDGSWDVEVSSRVELVQEVYPPGDFSYDPADWREYDDLWLAPCVKGLPDEVTS